MLSIVTNTMLNDDTLNVPSRQAGFTLVEVLVSVFILSTALTGIVVLISSNISDANLIAHSYIANGLVQEGTEIVRNLRDDDFLASRSFGFSLPDGVYKVQWNSNLISGDPTTLLNKDSHGLYTYDAGTPTIFQRSVTISTPVGKADIEKKVVVVVSWPERNGTRRVMTEDHLFNWK